MRSRLAASIAAGLAAAVAAVSGCCVSMKRAEQIGQHMQTLNRVHAEPAMQAAARGVGAELLPVLPEEVFYCDLPGHRGWGSGAGPCIEWNPHHSALLTLRDAAGTVHQALPIAVPNWTYARLARRGDDLILLVPNVTRRRVDRQTQCDCDAMPHDLLPRSFVVFVVDGTPKPSVQTIDVPVTEDYVSFGCNTYLM